MSAIRGRIRDRFRDMAVGMDSAFDLFQQPVRETHPWYWDWLELRQDFEDTGRDMRQAMGMIDERGRQHDTVE